MREIREGKIVLKPGEETRLTPSDSRSITQSELDAFAELTDKEEEIKERTPEEIEKAVLENRTRADEWLAQRKKEKNGVVDEKDMLEWLGMQGIDASSVFYKQ
jgi:hypothetical protein